MSVRAKGLGATEKSKKHWDRTANVPRSTTSMEVNGKPIEQYDSIRCSFHYVLVLVGTRGYVCYFAGAFSVLA